MTTRRCMWTLLSVGRSPEACWQLIHIEGCRTPCFPGTPACGQGAAGWQCYVPAQAHQVSQSWTTGASIKMFRTLLTVNHPTIAPSSELDCEWHGLPFLFFSKMDFFPHQVSASMKGSAFRVFSFSKYTLSSSHSLAHGIRESVHTADQH